MGSIIRFRGNRLDPATLRALATGTLIEGNKLSAWWSKQSRDFLDGFMREIRTSMQNGESVTQAVTRITGGTLDGVQVPGIMKTTKAKANALTATAMNRVSNEAALQSFQANRDVIKWVTQLSTLDNKTSDICIAYSGQTWDIQTLQPVNGSTLPFNGGPPRHFNCRSRLRPVTKSFEELGVDAKEIPRSTRASMDGQVPADITFNQFLKGKPTSFQDKLLGPKRAQLWRDDKITLTQLVDMRGNPMTLRQLEQRAGIRGAEPGVVKGPPRITSLDNDKYVELNVGAEDVRKVFTTNRADKGERMVMVHRDILEDGWKKDQGYIPADLSENTIGNRIKGFEDFLKDNNVIRVGNVSVDDVTGRISFGDGRHRARVLLNRGMTRIPISMSDDSLAALQKYYRTSFGKRTPLSEKEIARFKEMERQMEKARRDRFIAERDARKAKKPALTDEEKLKAKQPEAKKIIDELDKKHPDGLIDFENAADAAILAVQDADPFLASALRERAFKVIDSPARQDVALLARVESRIDLGVPEISVRKIILNSKATDAAKSKANDLVTKAVKKARKEAEDAFGLLDEIEFSGMDEYAAWVKSIRPGLSKQADKEFMKLVELGEGKVATNAALREVAKQIDIGDLGQAEQALKNLGPELQTKQVRGELAKLAKLREEMKEKVLKTLDTLVDDGMTPAQIENVIDITTSQAKPTMKIMLQDEGYKLVQKAQLVIDDLVAKFPFKVLDDLHAKGFSKQQTALLDGEFLEQTALLKNGVFDDAVKTAMANKLQDATDLIEATVIRIKNINKKSLGVDKMTEAINNLPDNLRTSTMLQNAIKTPLKQAAKKAKDARAIVMNELEDILGSDKFATHVEVIKEGLKDVHKKLGPKQLKDKVTELEVKVAQANKAEISIAEYAKDLTNYDEQVIGLLDEWQMKALNNAVKDFIKDGAGSSSAKENMLTVLSGKSAKQTRAIREYVHRRVNPKKLANDMDFDKAVAEIVTKHVNNASHGDIRKHIDALVFGSDKSTRLHFEQTIMTRAGVKNVDELGVFAEGDAPANVLQIRAQLAKNDPGNVPIPAHTADEQFNAAKEWLNSKRFPDDQFKSETLSKSKTLVANGEGVIERGDDLFGEGSWGISRAEWKKWTEEVAPTLNEWDVALINQYTGGMAGRINAGLYNGGVDPLWTAGARALNTALDKMPKHTGTVYRATQGRSNWTADFIDARYEVGKTVTERGFGSSATQTSAQFTGNLQFIIKTKGKSGAIIGHLGQYGTQEMEVLFKSGTKFRVIKKSRAGGGIKVWMEEI